MIIIGFTVAFFEEAVHSMSRQHWDDGRFLRRDPGFAPCKSCYYCPITAHPPNQGKSVSNWEISSIFAGISSQFLAVKILRANFTIHCIFSTNSLPKIWRFEVCHYEKKNLNPSMSSKFSIFFFGTSDSKALHILKIFFGFCRGKVWLFELDVKGLQKLKDWNRKSVITLTSTHD